MEIKEKKQNDIQKKAGKICKRCGKGYLEEKCDGRVYVCSNPKCKNGLWVYR